MTFDIHDVLIIGAGPAGLAVAARLRESTPSAVFTDAEHSRYQWLKKHDGRMNIRRLGRNSQPKDCLPCCRDTTGQSETVSGLGAIDIKVLDGCGPSWLHSWKGNFAALEISHLRSPMFFHPCPRDRDGLLAFAHETGRADSCVEIGNCVGKSMSKHRRKKKIAKGHAVGSSAKAPLEIDERDRKDYFNPSAAVFHDYCDEIVRRYSLDNMVETAQVTSVDYDCAHVLGLQDVGNPDMKLFKVQTAGGAPKFAKIVILAIGAGGHPVIPRVLSEAEREGAIHSTQMPKQSFLAPHVTRKIHTGKRTTVIVFGGGLTAAQIADKCVADGVSRVLMVMRSGLKLKPFDVDLEWMAKYRNGQKAAFWSADSDEERLEMLLKARNGGSITPRFYTKKLLPHIDRGTLSIHTQTSIKSQSWNTQLRTWNMEADPPIPCLPSQIDYIYYATGVRPDVTQLPLLSPLREKNPIRDIGGFPCLTNDLSWAEDVPLFVAGRLAGLRIGPDCGNLEGARVGAERISWAVQETLERQHGVTRNDVDEYCDMCERVGSVNMYESLDSDSG